MVIAKDTMTISQIATKDSISTTAKIDSIIIEEYAADEQTGQAAVGRNNHGNKACPCQKRNDTSQKETGSLKKKIKIYGANISGTYLSKMDSINKRMSHNQKTNSDIKQKTPTKSITEGDNVYAIAVFVIALFIGYLIWKNAVQ